MTAEERTLRVAAVQMRVATDPAINRETIAREARRAVGGQAQVVLFPEAALTGYSPDIGRPRDPAEWPAIVGHLEALAALSGELGAWLVVGTEAWADDAWVNRLVALSPEGRVAAQYDKMYLTPADRKHYRRGSRPVTLEICGVTVGLQICYDVRFPEAMRPLLDRGAEVVLQAFNAVGGDTWKLPVLCAHLRSRAAENGCYMVAANAAGPLQFMLSQVVDPLGLVVAQANQDVEETIAATLYPDRVVDSFVRQDYLALYRPAPQPSAAS